MTDFEGGVMTKPTRTCDLPNCGRKHRAKGYCNTHYNAIIAGEAKRHPKTITSCSVCAEPVLRRSDSAYQPTCSVACRTIVQFGQVIAGDSYAWRADAIKRAREYGCTIVDTFDREEIFERDNWACQGCGIACNQPDPYDLRAATIDHVIALHLGGDHSRANAQTLCLSCNSRKADAAISPAA